MLRSFEVNFSVNITPSWSLPPPPKNEQPIKTLNDSHQSVTWLHQPMKLLHFYMFVSYVRFILPPSPPPESPGKVMLTEESTSNGLKPLKVNFSFCGWISFLIYCKLIGTCSHLKPRKFNFPFCKIWN
jgi:hypothetical protein